MSIISLLDFLYTVNCSYTGLGHTGIRTYRTEDFSPYRKSLQYVLYNPVTRIYIPDFLCTGLKISVPTPVRYSQLLFFFQLNTIFVSMPFFKKYLLFRASLYSRKNSRNSTGFCPWNGRSMNRILFTKIGLRESFKLSWITVKFFPALRICKILIF